MAFKIRDASGWTMFVFGAIALVLGGLGLLFPSLLLRLMGFIVVESRPDGDYTRVFITTSSMASVNMGVYYILAVRAGWTAFYRWTVPFRMLTFIVFTVAVINGTAPMGFVGIGVWELAGALATGIALASEGQLFGDR